MYWPAFLPSAGQPQPTHIRVHPYLTFGQLKLSKSSGITVDPVEIASTYGTDALRWWFARDVTETADTDFTVERLIARSNEDLAGGIGNLINRVVTLVQRYRHGVAPAVGQPLDAVVGLAERVRGHIGRFELRSAAQEIFDAVGALNQDLERSQPWKVAKDDERSDELNDLLARHVSSVREIARALQPITPALSARATAQLTGHPTLPPPQPTFVRLERE